MKGWRRKLKDAGLLRPTVAVHCSDLAVVKL